EGRPAGCWCPQEEPVGEPLTWEGAAEALDADAGVWAGALRHPGTGFEADAPEEAEVVLRHVGAELWEEGAPGDGAAEPGTKTRVASSGSSGRDVLVGFSLMGQS
ncbi:MAG: hypothetical protein ACFN04_07225, partial [Propionibacterium acidifaciens]